MTGRSLSQRAHLVGLALRIINRRRPLGVGMHNECWGAVAAGVARAAGRSATEYYGISFRLFKDAIKGNAEAHESIRNRVMTRRTLKLALEL